MGICWVTFVFCPKPNLRRGVLAISPFQGRESGMVVWEDYILFLKHTVQGSWTKNAVHAVYEEVLC